MTESIKIKSILITVIIMLTAFATSAVVQIGEFKYEFDDTNQTATVARSSDKANSPNLIPEKVEYNGKEYTVTGIGEDAFRNCTYTGEFKIPKTIKTIGPGAFMFAAFTGPLIINDEVETLGSSSCRYLRGITEKIYVGKSVHTIGVSCFDNGTCTNVSEIIIMGKDLNIQNTTGGPFGYANSTVKRIYFSEEVKGLSRRVFNLYDGVEEVICEGTVPPKEIYIADNKGWSFWGGCCKKAVLKVPEESIDAYKKSIVWKDFINIQAIETNPTGISISQAECTLFAGETVSLSATVEPFYVRNKDIQWSVSDNKIATINTDGTVKALSAGTTTVYASGVGGASASCVITVKDIPVSGINIDFIGSGIDGDNLSMYAGDTKLIKVNITPSNATDKTLSWESSSPSIVSVNPIGEVKALSVGEADITVTAVSGASAILHVIVLPTAPSSITLNKAEAMLKATETMQLEATVSPEATTDKTVTWTTSDPAVATVDGNGVVTAVAVGKATITATTTNGLKAICAITVAETPASRVVIDKEALGLTGDNLEMRVGDIKTIKVTIEPETTTDKSVSFTSSSPEIATVEADGMITAIALGETTITISAKSGVSAKIEVKVVPTPVESITLSETEASLKPKETLQLEAIVMPETATNKTIIWSSSDEEVAAVSDNGLVTALTVGEAVITATTADGTGLSTVCRIMVDNYTGIDFIFEDGTCRYDVYRPDGTLLQKNADKEYMHRLSKGIYIIRMENKTLKLLRTSN